MNVNFSEFLFCIFQPEVVLGLFMLSISVLFGFISSSPLSFLLDLVSCLCEKKYISLFVIEYFLDIFGT